MNISIPENTKTMFGVGSVVRCIGESHGFGNTDPSFAGFGWKKGLVFKVVRVENFFGSTIYYGGIKGNGVREAWLETDSEWDE